MGQTSQYSLTNQQVGGANSIVNNNSDWQRQNNDSSFPNTNNFREYPEQMAEFISNECNKNSNNIQVIDYNSRKQTDFASLNNYSNTHGASVFSFLTQPVSERPNRSSELNNNEGDSILTRRISLSSSEATIDSNSPLRLYRQNISITPMNSPQRTNYHQTPIDNDDAQQQQPPSQSSFSNTKSEPSTNAPKRIKIDKAERMESRIAENKYDVEAWLSLLGEVLARDDTDKVRGTFQRYLQLFPASSRQWMQYVEFELKHNNYRQAEETLKRSLRSVLSIDLWKYYLNYVRRMNGGDPNSSMTPKTRKTIEATYEFVLGHIGLDMAAGTLWVDYLFFLKIAETNNSWEEQYKVDQMRKVFKRATSIPIHNVEHIWKDYDAFENDVNKQTARKFLQESSPFYMTARSALKELRGFMDEINRTTIPIPPKWEEAELQQLDAWKRWIAWEKSNPLAFEDKTRLVQRVKYAYKQAMIYMRHYPEIWYEASNYWIENGKEEETANILKTAMEIMPTSFLVHFAYAELQERRQKLPEGVDASRGMFSKARKYPYCSYHIFIAAAWMEYHCNKDHKVAGNIFELGLRSYGGKPEYVIEYLDFLIKLNDDKNARALFERALLTVPVEKANLIWDKYCEFENYYGDIESIRKIEQRRAEKYPDESPVIRFAQRHSYFNTNIIFSQEIGSGKGRIDTRSSTPPPEKTVQISKSQEEDSSDRRKLLESVYPDRYPRPDFRKWVSYKPSADLPSRPSGTRSQGLGRPTETSFIPAQKQTQPPAQVTWKQAQNGMILPEAVVNLLGTLPPPFLFQGPFVNTIELTEVMRTMKVEGGSQARGGVAMGFGEEGSYAENPRGGGYGGSGRVRGGGFGKQRRDGQVGGGRVGAGGKRRRRAFEEEETDAGSGGLGINQPPEHDLFRERQQKRARAM
ncbi:6558_t:CDS:10 [Ambispora gerdemannii]|uniref:6558_t:CDS:1 n=1 Tax=Ambispora gerdemannii TaxID=144530 RepID=A0A9N8VFT8_9GLOM|nr:6558_t:CDS:10 [Ambispora gerdemannii]